MLALEDGLDVSGERKLDGFAGGARGGNDDDSTTRMLGAPIRFGVRREQVVAGDLLPGKLYASPVGGGPDGRRHRYILPR